jgi:hypothetical protein
MSLLSNAQLAANRRNALLSKGAVSPEGKAVVRNNALRHGLSTDRIVLPDEDPAAFTAMREALIRDHVPANDQEADLVDQIAATYWRLLRVQRVETGLFESAMHPQAPRRTSRETMEIHDPFAQAFCTQSHHFDNLRRYTATIERAYYRALETLRKLQTARVVVNVSLRARGTRPVGGNGIVPVEPEMPVATVGADRPYIAIPPQINDIGFVSHAPCATNERIRTNSAPFAPINTNCQAKDLFANGRDSCETFAGPCGHID